MNNFPIVATGTVEGTGAAINVSVGFAPRHVRLVNIDDAGTLCPMFEWIKGMAAASAVKTLKQVDSGSTGLSSTALVTSNGISEYAGSDTVGSEAAVGFTIGADADINASAETIVWVAYR